MSCIICVETVPYVLMSDAENLESGVLGPSKKFFSDSDPGTILLPGGEDSVSEPESTLCRSGPIKLLVHELIY